MPRKRRHVRLSEYKISTIDPEDRNAVEDHDLVRHALVDFDEVAVLPSETREQLVADLVGVNLFRSWRRQSRETRRVRHKD